MKISVKKQIPGGSYRSIFAGVKETQHAEYGPGLCWEFEITSGTWRGEKVYRTTKSPATSKNGSGKFLAALTGLPLDQASAVDTEALQGTPCIVLVAVADGGSSRVESFVREQSIDPEPAVAGEVPFYHAFEARPAATATRAARLKVEQLEGRSDEHHRQAIGINMNTVAIIARTALEENEATIATGKDIFLTVVELDKSVRDAKLMAAPRFLDEELGA
jgi:hypothetical protein